MLSRYLCDSDDSHGATCCGENRQNERREKQEENQGSIERGPLTGQHQHGVGIYVLGFMDDDDDDDSY